MATAQTATVLSHVRRLALGRDGGDLTDAQLLTCFLEDQDDAAFTVLVRRHGPMVLGVCRRVLRDLHDAEDAFQATFLILLRKARSIAEPERLGNWLYGVAFYTARNARTARRRRQAAHDRLLAFAKQQTEVEEPNDWKPLLDQELSRLPEKYRVPLVLCELEGQSRHEAAEQLGWSEGTLSSRLARGRALLRQRLTRRGFAISAAALAGILHTQTAAAVSPALVTGTLQTASAVTSGSAIGAASTTAITLMHGVVHAMFLTKLKITAMWIAIVGMLGLGVALVPRPALAQKPGAVAADEAKGDKKKAEAGPTVSGNIQAIDPAKQTITLITGDKANKQEKTFTLSKEVKVLIQEGGKGDPAKPGKLADLSTGMGATLRLSDDSKSVVAIIPAQLHVMGSVMAVNADQRAITIRVKDKSGPGEQSYTLVADARILLNDGLKKNDPDTEGKLADLAEGMAVQLHVSLLDKSKVLGARVHGGSLHGEVKGLDTGNKTITLTVKEDAQVVDKTLTLAPDARVDSDLAIGDRASVRLSVFDKTKAVAVQKVKMKGEQE